MTSDSGEEYLENLETKEIAFINKTLSARLSLGSIGGREEEDQSSSSSSSSGRRLLTISNKFGKIVCGTSDGV